MTVKKNYEVIVPNMETGFRNKISFNRERELFTVISFGGLFKFKKNFVFLLFKTACYKSTLVSFFFNQKLTFIKFGKGIKQNFNLSALC